VRNIIEHNTAKNIPQIRTR